MADLEARFAGNLTRDPELRFTNGGKAVASFSVACTRKYQDQESTTFIQCTAWDRTAENLAASARKGDRVVVFGRLEERSWEDRDGNKRTTIQCVVDEIGLSLRFHPAHVDKAERSSDPKPQRAAAPAAAYDPDEEPF